MPNGIERPRKQNLKAWQYCVLVMLFTSSTVYGIIFRHADLVYGIGINLFFFMLDYFYVVHKRDLAVVRLFSKARGQAPPRSKSDRLQSLLVPLLCIMPMVDFLADSQHREAGTVIVLVGFAAAVYYVFFSKR